MCGRERTCSWTKTEVWQGKELEGGTSDVWQVKRLDMWDEGTEKRRESSRQAFEQLHPVHSGYPPRHFVDKSVDFIECKGVEFFGNDRFGARCKKEFARV
jgi:hypothetical protein